MAGSIYFAFDFISLPLPNMPPRVPNVSPGGIILISCIITPMILVIMLHVVVMFYNVRSGTVNIFATSVNMAPERSKSK